MILLKLILTLALPLFLGYSIVGLVAQNRIKLYFIERFALAYGIGIGVHGIIMFSLSLLSLPLNLLNCAIPAIIFIVLAVGYLSIKKLPFIDWPAGKELLSASTAVKHEKTSSKIAHLLLITLIGATIFYVCFDALVKPILNFDDLWRQGSIAKIIFTSGQVLTKQALEVAGPHPYLNPLSQAWIYLGIGTWNDALGKIVFALLFISLLIIFYSALRRSFPHLYALLITYLLTAFPLIIYHAGTAYSDFMQTFYYSAGILYLYLWIQKKQAPFLYFSAPLLGIGNFVKQAGLPLYVVATAVLFTYIFLEHRQEFKRGVKFFLLSIFVTAPWIFNEKSYLMIKFAELGSKYFSASSLAAPLAPRLPYGLPTLQNILYHLGRRMFFYADWQILWFMFVLVLIFCWKDIFNSKLKYLLLVIVLNSAMIIYAFFEPNTYQFLVDGTLVHRTMMYQIPLILFFVASCMYTPLTQDPTRKEKCL